mmetsp:Transcript_12740/g.32632  ORF Transcript_12740/g.32632 Transcript_12740/m.32632 type:complete len:164 (+) Transcript_12740:540-1031(+)
MGAREGQALTRYTRQHDVSTKNSTHVRHIQFCLSLTTSRHWVAAMPPRRLSVVLRDAVHAQAALATMVSQRYFSSPASPRESAGAVGSGWHSYDTRWHHCTRDGTWLGSATPARPNAGQLRMLGVQLLEAPRLAISCSRCSSCTTVIFTGYLFTVAHRIMVAS